MCIWLRVLANNKNQETLNNVKRYNVCRSTIEKCRKIRDNYIKNNTRMTKKVFILDQKIYKNTVQRRKIKFF